MDLHEQAAQTVRFLAIDAIESANSGHPGAVMGLADIGVELFAHHLRYCPEDPNWPNRDRFVLSCGHASMLLYALLHLAGYDLGLEELRQFRQWGSRTSGHPEFGLAPGIETTTGPLGQGIGNAVGMALAAKMMGARVNSANQTLIDYRVFVLASDGDLMEGITQEAASLAGHLGLDNLVVVYDDNRITIDGSTDLSLSDDPVARFQALGWFAQRVDGHDRQAFRAAMDRAVAESSRPSIIAAHTVIALGAPTKQGTSASHGAPLGRAEAEATKRAAGWPLEPKFHVPEGARAFFAEQRARNRALYDQWNEQLRGLPEEHARLWQTHATKQVPEDLLDRLLASTELKPDATRNIAWKVLQQVAEHVPSLVGGSADLAGSVKSQIKASSSVLKGQYAGKNLHFGVREHGMAAIASGLSLSGFFIPFAGTFLIFSDYMRPTLRLAALMKIQTAYLFSHDSVFVGEDGPTHQPIEQLSSLRLIPNLDVFRPADPAETAAAWTHALTRRDGPTAIITTRQTLPVLTRPDGFDPNELLAGAYVVADSPKPDLVLVATGSEVGLALEARALLAQHGIQSRLVSAPCWEAFERQPAERRARVLPPGLRRVTLEAGVSGLWRGIAGSDGLVIGIDDYGSSAPAERLAQELGLTGAQVAEKVRAWL
ncbi:MAG: transketolase [Polyangiaceae bacterium]|nr:transketolase [Polyangiaceae bacterium]